MGTQGKLGSHRVTCRCRVSASQEHNYHGGTGSGMDGGVVGHDAKNHASRAVPFASTFECQ